MIFCFVAPHSYTLSDTQLLNFLADWGYQISPPPPLPEVTYLGVLLPPTKRYITTDRKPLISALITPYIKNGNSVLWGLGWIPSFALLAQPRGIFRSLLSLSQTPGQPLML